MSKRPLCEAALFFALGIMLFRSQSGEGRVKWQVLCIMLICALCVSMAAAWHERKRRRAIVWLLLMPVWMTLGTARMWWEAAAPPGQELSARHKERAVLSGTIYDIQEKQEQKVLYLNHVCFLEEGGRDDLDSPSSQNSQFLWTCIAYYDGDKPCSIGNTIQVSGKISIFEEATNIGQFDAKSYYEAQGIDFSIFQIEILGNDNVEDSIKAPLYRMKQAIHKRVGELGGSHASILQAMLLGEKGQMDSEVKTLYQKSGISHVLVISGLHFSLIGMCLYQILRRIGCGFWGAGAISVAVLFFYGMMTGFGTSAVRAFIMFVISMGAQAIGTDYDLPSSLGAAVLYLLADNPLVIFQAGFLLSVGAVLGIILIIPAVEAVIPPGKGQGHEDSAGEILLCLLRRVCRAQEDGAKQLKIAELAFLFARKALVKPLLKGMVSGIGIQLATLPILLYFFYECAPYSIILNCLVLPLLPVVILGTIAALLISVPVPVPGLIVVWPSLRVLDLYEWLCRWCNELPGAQLVTGRPRVWQIAVYYGVLGLALACLHLWRRQRECHKKRYVSASRIGQSLMAWRERSPRGVMWLCAGGHCMLLAVFCLLFYGLFVWRCQEGMQVTMLDVGQGQSIYVRSGGMDILFDGGSTDVSKVGQYRIAPFLKASGVDRLNLVIVSHLDADHYNGVMELLEQDLIGIDCLMLPKLDVIDESYMKLTALAQEKGTALQTVTLGDGFWAGEAQCRVLHPPAGYSTENKNDTSIVLEFAYHDFKMLLTGDVEAKGEEHMAASGLLGDVDLLQAPHHGSSSSSTETFLLQTSPELVFISCGEGNRYGHPSPETMERLEALGSEVHVTMDEGSMAFYVE